MSEGQDDEVGYRKPPRHSRFKPGVSGNPRGRPKKPANVGLEIVRELNQKINVRENGVDRKLTKSAALAKSLVQKALAGDMRACGHLMRLLPSHFQPPQESAPSAQSLSAEEAAALERFVARRLAENQAATAEATPENLPDGDNHDG